MRAPRANLTLLDLMIVVAVFGMGFGLGQAFPGPLWTAKIPAGAVVVAILGPPALLAARRFSGRRRNRALRMGERLALVPSIFLLLPAWAILVSKTTSGGQTATVFTIWLVMHLIMGLFALIAFAARLVGYAIAMVRGKTDEGFTGLELYGYLLCLLLVWIAPLTN